MPTARGFLPFGDLFWLPLLSSASTRCGFIIAALLVRVSSESRRRRRGYDIVGRLTISRSSRPASDAADPARYPIRAPQRGRKVLRLKGVAKVHKPTLFRPRHSAQVLQAAATTIEHQRQSRFEGGARVYGLRKFDARGKKLVAVFR